MSGSSSNRTSCVYLNSFKTVFDSETDYMNTGHSLRWIFYTVHLLFNIFNNYFFIGRRIDDTRESKESKESKEKGRRVSVYNKWP